MTSQSLPLDMVLHAYTQGFFPMGDGEETYWHNPEMRAVLPLDLHVSRKLKSFMRKNPFEIRIDTEFAAVIDGCAGNRVGDWINQEIKDLFNALHRAGYAHCVECWQDGNLVGGVYGLALGGAFCAESMFSRVSNAGKVALVELCARLRSGGFVLLDCQIWNEHTGQFGAVEIPRAEYLRLLATASGTKAVFNLPAQD